MTSHNSTSSDATLTPESQPIKAKNEAALAAKSELNWGINPSRLDSSSTSKDPADLPPDHPVHKMSPEKQEKMRKKGLNPVLKAEMDEGTRRNGKEGRFWMKVGGTSIGSGFIR